MFKTSGIVLCATLLLANPCLAKQRDWKQGTLTQITDTAPGATASGAETAFRYEIKRSYYWLKAEGVTYVLVNAWAVGFHSPKAPLDLTVNRPVKFTVEGKNVFLIDDAGKQIERPLVAKIADSQTQ